METFSFQSKLFEKSTGGEICGGQIDDRLNDHVNLNSCGDVYIINGKMNSQVVPSLFFLYLMEEKQIMENLNPSLNLGTEAIF